MPGVPRFTQIDHVVVMVDDLGAAADLWRRLGFTLSPRGQHSDIVGTANHTVMFGDDYLELLVITKDTAHNRPWRQAMDQGGEGLYGVALATDSADAAQAALVAAGIGADPVIAFERMVERQGHPPTPARFRVTSTPAGTIDGVKLFVCQHLTRESVWLPELRRHPNTVGHIVRLDMQVPDLAEALAAWRRLLGDGAATAGRRQATLRIGRHRLRLRAAPGQAARITRLTLAVADLGAAARAVAEGGLKARISRQGALSLPAINGLAITFVQGG
jgi:hypothetical protein